MNNLRKIIYKDHTSEGITVERNGFFHTWGTVPSFGNKDITVAIVETLEGKIIDVDPRDVRFANGPQENNVKQKNTDELVKLFIYCNDGKVKVLTEKQHEENGKIFENQGWKNTSTINAVKFVEEICNFEVPSEELENVVNSLLK